MPAISFAQYCKLTGTDSSKTEEKSVSKKMEQMKDQSFSEIFSTYGKDSLSVFTVTEIKDELKARGLGYQGVKAELISRLEEALSKDSAHKRKSPERKEKETKHQKTDAATMDADFEGKNPGNVIGGYKATLHNENSSEEAKEHARKMLEQLGEDETPKADQEKEFDLHDQLKGKHKGNVIGGYKATLHNDKSTEEAKEHAKEVLEEMGVDPEEKAEKKNRSEPGYEKGDNETIDEMDLIDKDNKRVIGGYKATLHNENSSEEAKEHARSILKKLGVDPEEKEAEKEKDDEGKNPGNVIGGYKAAAHNPNLPEESREKAKQHLEELGVDAEEKADTKDSKNYSSTSKDLDLSYKHKGNVIGGYRATLHNPNSSEEAKDHARKMLKEMGVDPEGHADSHHHSYEKDDELAQDTLGKNPGNVIGGYRATLHNENSSEEAKQHAREQLEKLGADPEGHADPKKQYHHADTHGKNLNNVAGGYKATLHNDNVSEEAKDHAQKELDRMGVDADEKTDSSKSRSSSADVEGKNPNNVAGGYKATLKNPNVSAEAKDNAKEQLKNLAH